MYENLTKLYEQQPVIVICDDKQREGVISTLAKKKMNFADKYTEEVLDNIRQWTTAFSSSPRSRA